MTETSAASLPIRRAGVAPGASDGAIAAYGELRARVTDLFDGLDPDLARGQVPACPDWTVTDTLAHLVGVCVDIVEGNLDGVATTDWADGHVRRHADLGIDGLLARWQETAPTIDSMGGMVPDEVASQFVFDASSHEQDIRGAIDQPGGRDAASLRFGLGFLEQRLDALAVAGTVPSLHVATDTEVIEVGEGPPERSLRTTHYELFRTLGGRRSEAQIRSMAWDGDPTPYLLLFASGPLSPASTDVVE